MGLFNYFKELLGKDSETENEDVYVADSRTKHSDDGERADTVGEAEETTGFVGREIADSGNASDKGHGSTVIGENGLIKDKNSLADLLEKEGDQRSNRIDHEESVDTDFSEESLGEDSGDDFNIYELGEASDDKPGVWGDVDEDVDDVFDSSDLEELRKGSDGVLDDVEGFDSSASGVGEDQKFENSPAESGASVVKSGDGIVSDSGVEDRESDVPVIDSGVEDRESDVPVVKSGDGIVSDSGVEDRESDVPVVKSENLPAESDNTDDYLVAETASNDDAALNEITVTPEPGAVVSDSENSGPSPAVDEVTVPSVVGSGVVAGTSGRGVDFVEGEQVESVQDSSVVGSSVPWSVYLARQSEQVVGEAGSEDESVSTVGSEKDLDSVDSQEDVPDTSAPGLEGSRGLELSSDGEGAEVGEPSDLLDEDEGGEFVETDGDSGVVKSELEVDPSLVRGGSDEDDSKGDGGLHISIPGF